MRGGRMAGISSVAAAAILIAATSAASAAGATPEAELAAKFAPVVRLVKQKEPCGHGEPYEPTNVDVLFGSEDVVLRGPWDAVNVVKFAPLATDLTSGRFDYHLDFPGDALNPGCTYEQWSKRITRGTKPTVYAHVVTDKARPGKLALQYWFFYVFNDFNNLHEGDWEMVQLNFDASSAEDALSKTPTEVGYSQHEGGERASWGADKLQIVGGTHPVVYPAAGSHANQFRAALFLGRNGSQGVGCDDSEGPSKQLRPDVKVVPSAKADYLKEYPWLAFRGRWGELQPAFYNGPTGPNMKRQWTAPIRWSEDSWRGESFVVPVGGSFGPNATDYFCTAVAKGSAVLTKLIRSPGLVILTLAVLVALILIAAQRTSWSQAAPLRLARRRAWGEIVNSARRMLRSRPGVFIGIGLLFIPLGLLISGVQYLLFQVCALAPLVDTTGQSNVSVAGLALGLGLLFTLIALTFVQAATAQAMADIDAGRPTGSMHAYREALRRFPALLGAVLIAVVVIVILELTIIGIPIAIWLLGRWSLLGQVVQLERTGVIGALARSGQLVRHHWWRTASIVIVVGGLALIAGPVVGILLLLITSASFNFVNIIAGVVYMIAMPYLALATTYLYFDLKVRTVLEARARDTTELPAEI
jgi:hypothetical protein